MKVRSLPGKMPLMKKHHSRWICWTIAVMWVMSHGSSLLAVGDGLIDSPMYRSPPLPEPKTIVEFLEAKELWLNALARPEADMKCKAAETIVAAHLKGVKGLDSTIEALLKEFDQIEQPPAVRLTTARALIVLDAKSTAAKLFARSQTETLELREMIEPALARWDFQPAKTLWLARLQDQKTPSREMLLAIRGLRSTNHKEAIPALQKLALSSETDFTIRLEAAEALGTLQTQGLEADAERLAGERTRRFIVPRLAAVALLRHHSSEKAIQILQSLLLVEEPAVATQAAEVLLARDPKTLLASLEYLLSRPDPRLRTIAVEVMRKEPTLERIDLLVPRLDDEHAEVRSQARVSLLELAKQKAFRDRLLPGAMKILGGESWRGLEQSALLLTQLDHQPAARRMVDLLSHSRPEVLMSSAWGLRKLAVAETLPDVLKYVEKRLKSWQVPAKTPDSNAEWYDHQGSQLIQLLGQQKYVPADASLRKFIPRIPAPSAESRSAAVWALGLIHEGKPNPEISAALIQRLNEGSPFIPPEDDRIRRMSAITLGRMMDKDSITTLRTYTDQKPSKNAVNNACGWAIEQLTGEKMPAPETERLFRRDWFLTSTE